MHKRLCQPNKRKYGISEDLNQNDDRIISRKLEQYQRFLQILIINIYVFTKRQTENRFSSCSIVNLKTLFKFVSQCNLVPFLESRLCNVGNALDNCDFAVVNCGQVTDLFGNLIVKRINMRVFDLLARFHYILNLPRI